jgi:beta-lactamase superfamily II metal-dependent hydrolase
VSTVTVLDVGQGSCVIGVDEGTRRAVIVDCPAGASTLAAERLQELGAVFDTALVSHTHDDHLAGIVELADLHRPDAIYYNDDRALSNDPEKDVKLTAVLRALEWLGDRGVRLMHATAPKSGTVGEIRWHILAPLRHRLTGAYARRSPNAAAAVVLLEVDGYRFLLGGDAQRRLWRDLLDGNVDISADVFLIPHHGGAINGSRTRKLLAEICDAVGARYHAISVAADSIYGHPRRDVLEELNSRVQHARLLCTQANGWCRGAVSVDDVRAHAATVLPPTSDGYGLRGSGCPCAGSIVFEVSGTLRVAPSDTTHDAVVAVLETPYSRLGRPTSQPGIS